MRYPLLLYISLLLSCWPLSVYSQPELDSLEIAEAYLESENFSSAIGFYQRFLMQMPDDPDLNFKMGFSLLNTSDGKAQSVEYFEKAVKIYRKKEGKKSVEHIESLFYLARAYRSAYRFEEAIEQFDKLDKLVKNRRIRREIEKELELCHTGMQLTQDSISVDLVNMGDSINSRFSDHSPVISADESVLIFTSRRANDSGGEPDMDGQYDEDIFIAFKKDDGNWTKPAGISKNINTPDHEASIGLSVDGQKLFIYKPEDEGSIYVSDLEGLEWGEPQKLGANINTGHRETHASLSADGQFLYFASGRPGGLGGLDIYVSEVQSDGSWGPAKNLGDAVNTPLDENSPYIHPDGKTLYFSSEGHKNMGGYDVFTAERNQFGTFTKAQNMGYPLNTVQDDIFYLPTPDGRRAYFASKRTGGLGDNDLYLVNNKSADGTDISVMVGYVYTECTDGLPKADITLTNEKSAQEWYYTPNSNNGKFVFVVNRGEAYTFEIKVDDKLIFSDKVFLEADADYQQEYKSIRLDPDKRCDEEVVSTPYDTVEIDEKGNPIFRDEDGEIIPEERIEITKQGDTIIYDMAVTAENILFDTNSDDFSGNETTKIIAEYLKNNPGAVIEIGGYTDAVGNSKYNYYLSVKRARSVQNVLINLGVSSEQLKIVGYGEENPIAYNKTNGYYNYKTLRYNRRVEFKVLKQGENTLRIRPIVVLPGGYKNPDYQKDYQKKERNDIETEI